MRCMNRVLHGSQRTPVQLDSAECGSPFAVGSTQFSAIGAGEAGRRSKRLRLIDADNSKRIDEGRFTGAAFVRGMNR